jgi:2-C-methyl-D-erythritol 4-phosphate cytidylyltransferase
MSTDQKMHNTAVLLAAGKGTRLGGEIPKQYRRICGLPLAARSYRALAESEVITDIVMVIPKGDDEYVRESVLGSLKNPSLLEKFRGFAYGGAERYHSVVSGLDAIDWPCDYVFIHDGARPFIDGASMQRLYEAVQETGAAVAAVPSKDTVKIANELGLVASTPDRSRVWIVQTPQVFERRLIADAYHRALQELPELEKRGIRITDDAMVAEEMAHAGIRLVEASYRNIKITTPEDIAAAEAFLKDAGQDQD